MIKIDRRQTDKFIIFDTGNRLDMVSNDYYGNPNYYWIILMANPKYSMPDQIQNGDQIRIPLPLSDVFEDICKHPFYYLLLNIVILFSF